MAAPIQHTLLAFALVGSLFAACGGKTAGDNPDAGSGGSSGGSSGSSGGSSGSSGGSTSGGSSGSSGGSSGGGSVCTDINPRNFDQTCTQNSDCFIITTGTICTGACLCGGGAAINVSGEPRYQAAISGIATGVCGCPPELPPACSGHTCVLCTGAPSDPPECGPTVIGVDAGVLCKQGPSGGSGGGGDSGACDIQGTESCSDGTTYNVRCTCPDAVCTCSESSANMGGSSGGGIPFKGCAASCAQNTLQLAYEACGFPLPH